MTKFITKNGQKIKIDGGARIENGKIIIPQSNIDTKIKLPNNGELDLNLSGSFDGKHIKKPNIHVNTGFWQRG